MPVRKLSIGRHANGKDPGDCGGYTKLREVGGGMQSTVGGRKRIVANGTLVCSAGALGKRVGAPTEKWWRDVSVLHAVFEHLGLPQLFLGFVDDTHRLYHDKAARERVKETCLVNKQWYMSAKTMTVADFRPLRHTLIDESLQNAFKCLRYVRQLVLAECRRVKFLLPSYGIVGKNILVLNLVGCSNLTDATLSALTMEMPKLRELYVPACAKLEQVAIAKHAEGSCLEALDISGNNKVADESIERLLADHPNLRELFASQMEELRQPRVQSPTLELINLDGCEHLTFQSALTIMKGCPKLRFVTLGDNDIMLEEAPKLFVPFANLEELNISATYQSDETIETAMQNIPKLRVLDASNSEFVVTPALAHPCLEVLVLNLCCEMKDTVFDNLETKLPKLRHLSLNHCDTLVRPQVRHSELLLADLSSCSGLCSDKRPEETWLVAPKLHALYLGHTHHVTDEELQRLIPHVPNVQDLNLYQASGLQQPNLEGLTKVAHTHTHRTAPHRTAPHRTAPHRTAPHRTAPHRTAPHRTAPHRTAPHRTAPHRRHRHLAERTARIYQHHELLEPRCAVGRSAGGTNAALEVCGGTEAGSGIPQTLERTRTLPLTYAPWQHDLPERSRRDR